MIHVLQRSMLDISGFPNADRSPVPGGQAGGGHLQRNRPGHEQEHRLLVNGSAWSPGFGVGYIDSDLWLNQGEGLPTRKGPDLYGYGIAGVIDNYGGTGAELDRAEAAGRIIRADIDDLFVVEDPAHPAKVTVWRLTWSGFGSRVDRHNIKFIQQVPEAPKPKQVLTTLPDGQQIMFMSTDPEPYIKYRPSHGGSWGVAFPIDERPHQKRTVFVGEW